MKFISIRIILVFLIFGSCFYVSGQTSPRDIPGLVLWYSADSVLLNENQVNTWWDKSGQGNHAIQETQSNQPTLVDSIPGLNGNSAIRFDGLNDKLLINSGNTLGTLFIIANWSGGSSFPTYNGLINHQTSTIILDGDINKSSFLLSYSPYFGNQVFINGEQKVDFSPMEQHKIIYGVKNTPSYLSNYVIGQDRNLSSRFWNGNIAEILMFEQPLDVDGIALIEQYLKYKYFPPLELGENISANKNELVEIVPNIKYGNFIWSTGATTSTITVEESGTYSLTVTDYQGAVYSDEVSVLFYNRLNDTILCIGDTLVWDTELTTNYSFEWSPDQVSSSVYIISNPGDYSFKTIDANGNVFISDTLTVTVDSFSILGDLGPDTSLCKYSTIALDSEDVVSWLWSNGSTQPFTSISKDTTYWLRASNANGCISTDTVVLGLSGVAPNVSFTTDTVCFGDSTSFTNLTTIEAGFSIDSVIWDFGADTSHRWEPRYLFHNDSIYPVTLTAFSSGCSSYFTDTALVKTSPQADFTIKYGNIQCENNSVSFENTSTSSRPLIAYSWGFGDGVLAADANAEHSYNTADTFMVRLTIQNDLACRDSVFSELIIRNSLPMAEPFGLLSPENQAASDASSIDFSWQKADFAIYYRLILSADSLFSQILLDSTEIDTNHITVSLTFPDTLYWKVQAFNLCGDITESAVNVLYYFSPAQTNYGLLWFNAKQQSLLLNEENRVSSWNNSIDTTIKASQSTLNLQPLFVDSIAELNNHPAIYFETDKLDLGNLFDIDTLRFVTTLLKAYPTGNYEFFLSKGYSGDGYFTIGKNNADDRIYYWIDKKSGLSSVNIDTSWVILTTELDRLNKKINLYKNGVLAQSISTTEDLLGTNSYSWTIGGDPSGTGYSFKGYFTDILYMDYSATGNDRINTELYLKNKYAPPVKLPESIIFDYGFPDTTLNAYKPWFTSYRWSNGSTDSALTVSQSGTYSVTVTDIFGFTSSDSITLTYPELNYPISSADTILCLGDTLWWNTGLSADYTFNWFGSTLFNPIIPIYNPGQYAVKVIDSLGNYLLSDTLTVTVDSFSILGDLGPDTSLCKYSTIALDSEDVVSWLWSNGSTQPFTSISKDTTYWLRASNANGCISTDTVVLGLSGVAPNVSFTTDTVCFGDSTSFTNLTTIEAGFSIDSVIWDFGADTSHRWEPRYLFHNDSIYPVTLTAFSSGCSSYFTDTALVKTSPQADFTIKYGNIQCENNSVSFENTSTSSRPLIAYSWGFGDGVLAADANAEHSYNTADTFMVRLTIQNDLACRDSVFSELIIRNSLPMAEPFGLLSPENQAASDASSIDFSWQKADFAIYYRLILSADSLFSQILLDSTEIDTNHITVSLTFPDTLYWKVQAFNLCGDITESAVNVLYYFSPAQTNYGLLWFNAKQQSLLLNEENRVSSWNNSIDTTIKASQSTLNLQPLFVDSIAELNNHPAIYFETDKLDLGNLFDIDTLRFVTTLLKAYPTGNYEFFLSKGYSGDGYFTIGKNNADDRIYYWIDKKSGLSSVNIDTSWVILTTELDRLNKKINLYKNGVLAQSISTTEDLLGTNSYSWTIGGDPSGTGYSFKGYFTDILYMDYSATGNDRINTELYLKNKYAPPVKLPESIIFDYGFPDTTLNAYKPWFTSYRWSNGSTDSALTVSQSGTYSVTVTDIFGFTSSDSITLTYPQPKQIASAELCRFDTLLWNPQLVGNYSYEWSNGSSTPTLNISEPGDYWLIIRDSLSYAWYSDTSSITVDEFPQTLSLGADTTLCLGNRLYVQVGQEAVQSYLWSDGSTLDYLEPETSGSYAVTATNALGCVGIDTLNLSIQGIAPLPDFSVTQLCHKDSARFADLSLSPDGSDIVTWVWDFGEGSQGEGQFPKHRYEYAGEYTVSLTVRNELNCSNSLEKTVEIHALPQAAFSPLTACSNTPVSFSDNSLSASGEVNQWQWTFPDGSTQITTHPEFSFAASGAYPVQLVVRSDLGCYDTLVQNIDIKLGPLSDFTFGPVCEGLPVAFSDQSISFLNLPLEYHWDFGDGSESNLSSPEKAYATTGSYEVSLQTTQTSNRCSSTVSKTIVVNANPIARFNLPITCVNTPVELIDQSESSSGTISEWVWNVDSLGTIRSQNPSVSFAYPGTYQINLSVSDGLGCSDSVEASLTVHPLPTALFESSVIKGPVPLLVSFTNRSLGAVGYLWDFGDGAGSTETHPQHTFVDSGSYTVQLRAISAEGCPAYSFENLRGIVPRVDLRVLELSTETTSGYLKVRALLQNQGTLDLEQITLQVQTPGSKPLREELKSTLYSGQTYLHEFATQLPLDANHPLSHVCVNAFDAVYPDEFPDNNEICRALEDAFKMLPSYPNPANDYLVVEYLIPDEARITISLFDGNGKIKAVLYDQPSGSGFNRHRFNIAGLGSGVYFYKISYKGTQHTRSFVVN
ncbi:MAG: PKD domain-containing protein [Salinivirgaceae bacterium]